jgi:hypothetical protein
VARAKAKTIGPAPSLDNIEKVLNPKV